MRATYLRDRHEGVPDVSVLPVEGHPEHGLLGEAGKEGDDFIQ